MIRILDNESLTPIFESSSPMRVDVKPTKKATRHTVETGATRSDHVIDNLLEITIDLVLTENAQQEYNQISQYFDNRDLVAVQTGMGVFINMLIEDISHSESAQVFEGAMLPMRLVEWREIKPEYGELKQEQVKRPQHSSTAERGRQSGTEVESERGKSVLYGIFN